MDISTLTYHKRSLTSTTALTVYGGIREYEFNRGWIRTEHQPDGWLERSQAENLNLSSDFYRTCTHVNSTGTATEHDVTLIKPTDDEPASPALVLVSKPAGASDELATNVASLASEYNNLDSAINDLTTELLGQERKLVERYQDELLPLLDQMQMLLSQRGDLHSLVAEYSSLANELKQLEDLPTWTEWYEAFASRVSEAKSLRTVQRQLKKRRGGTGPTVCDDTSSAGEDTDDGADECSFHSGLYRDDEVKSAAELLAEHAKMMLDVLTGNSITMSDAMRITRAVSLVKDLQLALEVGLLVVTASGPTPKVPAIEYEIVPDRTRDAMATLRGVFNRMADTADIENALQEALQEFIQPMIAEHPYMQVDAPYQPKLQVSVTLYRPGRARISTGDWVEYRGGDDRLTKKIGAEAALGHVVEADTFSRPRITWFDGSKWLKPHALFDQDAVHVLFADQAASAYPEAFSTYSESAGSKPPTAVPTMEADASTSSAPSAVAAPAVLAGAQGVVDALENPVLPNAVSPSPAENQAEGNLPAHSTGSVTRGFLPHGEATQTRLVPGKKYQVRPAPSGGYGIYEPRSPVLMQWYAEEDEARDAIDSVIATAACA